MMIRRNLKVTSAFFEANFV